jgi:fatty-acid desaturase
MMSNCCGHDHDHKPKAPSCCSEEDGHEGHGHGKRDWMMMVCAPLIIAGYALALFVAGGPLAVIFGYCIPASLCLHSSSAIIVIAHRHGYKTHKCRDESRNSWIANIITLGEGWHNNHHARPYAWSNWERWWEWDIPAIIIWMVKKS